MNTRLSWFALCALVVSTAVAQPWETFTNFVRPGETFFAGDWADLGEQPAARLRQASGSFEIRGTNGSRSFVDVYPARTGAFWSLGTNRYVQVTAQVLDGNQAASFRVFLIDTAGRTATATFSTADFSASAFRTAASPLSFSPEFDPAAIERFRISGDAGESAQAFAFAFAEVAAVGTGPAVEGALRNFSLRSQAGTGANTAIVGFIIPTGADKAVLLRGVGPTLASFGVAGVVADPQLQVFRGNVVVAANDNWGTDPAADAAFRRAGAFPLASGSRDAAVVATLAPGAYTVQLGAATGGTALAELYDMDDAPLYPRQRFTNVAARTTIGAGAAQATAGFVIDGLRPRKHLLRLAGPALAALGMPTGFVADPRLQLTRIVGGAEFLIAQNDDWQTGNDAAVLRDATAAVAAAPFAANSRDAAVVVTLPPGVYMATASAPAGQTGVALFEIFDLSQ